MIRFQNKLLHRGSIVYNMNCTILSLTPSLFYLYIIVSNTFNTNNPTITNHTLYLKLIYVHNPIKHATITLFLGITL